MESPRSSVEVGHARGGFLQGREAGSDIATVCAAAPPAQALDGGCRHPLVCCGGGSTDAKTMCIEFVSGVVGFVEEAPEVKQAVPSGKGAAAGKCEERAPCWVGVGGLPAM